jgi:hypothetical protein
MNAMRPRAILTVALVLAGCRAPDLAEWAGGAARGRVVSGSVSAVNARVSRAFRDAGVSGGAGAAWVDERGEAMTVHGATPDGRTFQLSLREAAFHSTRVGIVWDGPPDDALGREILAGLGRE